MEACGPSKNLGVKGVILAAGKGVRLKPLTDITNKMLLPIFDRPMIMGPIDSLRSVGVCDICIVTNPEHVESFRKFLEVMAPAWVSR